MADRILKIASVLCIVIMVCMIAHLSYKQAQIIKDQRAYIEAGCHGRFQGEN